MSRKKRKRRRQRNQGGSGSSGGGPAGGLGSRAKAGAWTAPPRTKPAIVPWRDRARLVVRRLREWARDVHGPAIELFLRERLGDGAERLPIEDLERAFDDFLCLPGSAGYEGDGDPRSLVKVFAEEVDELEPEERRSLAAWQTDRRRKVYMLDVCHRDRLELWDPLEAERAVVHLLDRLPPARPAGLPRGSVVICQSAPWGRHHVALGHVEIYEDEKATEMYRREVRESGRTWHELPAPTPSRD